MRLDGITLALALASAVACSPSAPPETTPDTAAPEPAPTIDDALQASEAAELASAHKPDPSTGIGAPPGESAKDLVPVDLTGPTVTGGEGTQAAILDKVLKRRGAPIKQCYRRGLEEAPELGGQFAWEGTWVQGATTDIAPTAPSGVPSFDACIRGTISRVRAPADVEGRFRVEWELSRRPDPEAP